MFCLNTSSKVSWPYFEFSLKVKVMGSNAGYLSSLILSTYFNLKRVASILKDGILRGLIFAEPNAVHRSININPFKTVCSLCWGISNYADSESLMVHAWVHVCPYMLWSGSWHLNYICLIMWKSRSCCIIELVVCFSFCLIDWLSCHLWSVWPSQNGVDT